MKTEPRSFSSFPALIELGNQFRRVARAESARDRRSGWRRLVPALAVAAIVVPIGLATAQVSDSGAGEDPLVVPAHQVPVDFFQEMTPAERDARTSALSGDRPDGPSESNFAAEGVPPDWLVDLCRGVVTPAATAPDSPPRALHCKAILAIADGNLAPGEYSDAELRQLLDE